MSSASLRFGYLVGQIFRLSCIVRVDVREYYLIACLLGKWRIKS